MTNNAWASLRPADAAKLLSGYPGRWWIAGGWAIDLFLGSATRPHGDMDVAVLRAQQHLLRTHFAGWQVYVAHEGSLYPWRDGDVLRGTRHQFWARAAHEAPWTLELLLEDSEGEDWVFRRDDAVRRPLDAITNHTSDGIPYLAPEVALLYKAKSPADGANEADFEACASRLSIAQHVWLRNALTRVHPGHVWVGMLD